MERFPGSESLGLAPRDTPLFVLNPLTMLIEPSPSPKISCSLDVKSRSRPSRGWVERVGRRLSEEQMMRTGGSALFSNILLEVTLWNLSFTVRSPYNFLPIR